MDRTGGAKRAADSSFFEDNVMWAFVTDFHQRVRERCLRHHFADIADPERRHLMLAIASLPDAEHEVFRLARFEDCGSEQIAARLDIHEARAAALLILALQLIGRSVRRQRRRQW